MDNLLNTLIVGFAVAYLTELLGSVVERWFNPKILKQVISLPASVAGCWAMGIEGLPLVVCSGAATFVYLAVMMLLMKNDKPTVVNNRRNRYYGDI
jgi:hypothetical protein